MSIKFGSFIREKRIKKGFGQRELAAKIGVSASYLNDIEKDKRSAPKLNIIKKPEVKTTHNKEKCKNTFHPILMSWSYLNLGKVALTHKNTNSIKDVFKENHIKPGIILSIDILNGASHPPKNNIVAIPLIIIIAAYSPRKNIANNIEEYSVK